jgi:hypothetical protein
MKRYEKKIYLKFNLKKKALQMSDIDTLLNQYRSENNLSNPQKTSASTVSSSTSAASPMIILGWMAFVLLYIIAIIALVIAGLAYQKSNLSPAQLKSVQELTDNVVFEGKVLVAAGFSDALPPSATGTNFLVAGGAMQTESLLATGQLSGNVVVAGSGLSVLTGNISASESNVACSSINTSLVTLKQGTRNISITPNLLTIGNSASQATLNLQPSTLSFTNANGRTTSMSANGVLVPNQNLMGLRYVANGLSLEVVSSISYQFLGPISAQNTYGSLFISPSELSLPATFEISFAGKYKNGSGAFTKAKIALVNGTAYDDAQAFLGNTADVFSPDLPDTIVASGCAFEGKYTVTFLSFGLGTTQCFTTGQVSYGYATAPSILTNLNNTVITIDSEFGITFSLWIIWSIAHADTSMTLNYLSVKQLISIPS